MAVNPENYFTGDGSETSYNLTFEYIDETDVKVTLDGVLTTAYSFANATTILFDTAPNNNVEIRIYRDTNVDELKSTFFAGSSIRAQDLNQNFEQNNFAVQELKAYSWDNETATIHSDETWVSSDTQIATTAAMDARFLDEAAETILSTETWVSDDDHIATTASIDARFQDELSETITSSETWANNDDTIATTAAIDDQIDLAITNDIGTDGTGITVTDDGDGTITLGLGSGSIDLDRIKDADIITSAESNPNNDTTIATTAKIDDMIDAAITGDIAVDSTGLSVTDDGDGTITLGIAAGSVDLDRIKADDIITESEQDSGTTETDNNIFTAVAAAKRFDTLVQTGNPGTTTNWEVGKTWLQNDSNRTLSIWNGSAWLTVSEGGGFVSQPNVVYVDTDGGDNAADGHRISTPKETIKSAIEQINGEIEIDVNAAGFNGGSGYVDADYTNVSLTHSSGTGIGTGLTASITVSGGAVTAITLSAAQQTTLEEYSIGDVLTASNADLGGSGSGLLIPITGTGDGQIVVVAAGTYQEEAPIQIKRRNVSVIGQALRSCIVHPTSTTELNNLFELNSGSYISNLTLTGMQAGTGTGNTLDAVLPTDQGWNFAFYEDAFITKSPYIQNCTNFSDSEIDNDDLRSHRPRGGTAGDTDSAPTGGGMLVNGATPHDDSPLRSMVADSYTHVALNGPGILVTNNGYTQITSSYAFFNTYHIKCLNGGQANLAASTTDFGDRSLVADGRSTTNIFTANCVTAVDTSGAAVTTIRVSNGNADASWHGTSTRPASNMLLSVNSDAQIYPITNVVPQDQTTFDADPAGYTGDWIVTISRPDPNNRSNNLGFSDDVATGTDNVQFWLRSMIASSGHTMEYVGSGTDYTALPENGGVPIEARQITESNNGKVWTAITDHNGKFRIGGNQTDDPIFEVDQQLGFVTIPEGSIAFNLLSDETPQLGGDLDVNGNTITGLPSTPTANDEAVSKQYVDTQIGGIDEVVEDLTPQLGGDLDVNGQTITSASNGNIVIDPNGTGIISLGSNVGVGTSSPSTLLHTNATSADNELRVATTTSGNPIVSFHANGAGAHEIGFDRTDLALYFKTVGSSERMRIDSSGRVGIGTSSPGTDGYSSYDDLVIANSDHCGITIKSPNNKFGGINFSDTAGSIVGYIAYEHSSDKLYFGNAGSGHSAFDSSGNLGIGTTSPSTPLHVNASGSNDIFRLSRSDANGYLSVDFSSQDTNFDVYRHYTFSVSGSEKARIDSSGRLLVGTSTARANFYNGNTDPHFQLEGTDTPTSAVAAIRCSDNAGAPRFMMGKARGSSVGSTTIVASDDVVGEISFQGSDGTEFVQLADIQAVVDGTPGANDMPGRLVFYTTADGASSPTERVRIKSNGQTEFSGGIFGDYTTASSGNINFASGNFWEVGGQAVQNPTNEQPGLAGLLIAQSSAPTSFTTQWKHPGGSYTAPTSFPAVAPFVVTAADTILVGSWTEGIA